MKRWFRQGPGYKRSTQLRNSISRDQAPDG